MLKNEIITSLKQTAVILSFMLLLPVIHRINEMRLPGGTTSLANYMLSGGSLVVIMLIAGLAYMMFSREDNDDAMEYLKTLPISKWELLKIKILPRLVIVAASILGLILSYKPEPSDIPDLFFLVMAPVALTVIIALSFGFFLGISDRKNPILIGIITIISSYPVFIGFTIAHKISRYIVHQTHAEISVSLYALVHFVAVAVPVLIPLSLLIPVYKSWDCTSGKIRSQIILKRLAIPVILIVALWGISFPW